MIEPYYRDESVTLFCGDMREVLPQLDIAPDCIIADPPYGETSLAWDRWPDGWPAVVAAQTRQLWCFGSFRMWLARHGEFEAAGWRLAQDIIWKKNAGSGFAADRFKRVHEIPTHWYQGRWKDLYRDVPRQPGRPDLNGRLTRKTPDHVAHAGQIGPSVYRYGETVIMHSVILAKNMNRKAINPTEKPRDILAPLIQYSCPPGGLVLDVFAGSCSTGVTARLSGRRSVLIEADEAMCEKAVRLRLAQDVLPIGVVE